MRTDGHCLPLLLALTLMGGCAKEPFARVAMPRLENPDPPAIRAAFGGALPERFTSEDTVLIDGPFSDLAALGVLRVDRRTGSFDLMCLNPMGMQLFLLSGDRQHTDIHYAVPPLLEKREVLLAIAQDIRNIYLDLVPGAAARARIHSRYVLFREAQPQGTLEHRFGGAGAALLEKRRLSWLGTVWRVRYYEYTASAGGLFPRGMVLDNYRYHYRLVIRNRSWQVE